jgi:hypothetical protein
VTALAAQARAERADAGQVETGGTQLRDGNLAGTGDWIVTRDNNRRLALLGGRDWVKNGDAWRVLQRHQDGALTVQHLGHSVWRRCRCPRRVWLASLGMAFGEIRRVRETRVDGRRHRGHVSGGSGPPRDLLAVTAGKAA